MNKLKVVADFKEYLNLLGDAPLNVREYVDSQLKKEQQLNSLFEGDF